MGECRIKDCSGEAWSSGMCSRHYGRLRRTGTVEGGPKARDSFENRLLRQINCLDAEKCWPWMAKSRTSGYGVIALGGRHEKKILAHRAMWEMVNGPIPDGAGYHGTIVMHTCDNRLCCNPAHLRLGTQRDNVRDMDTKGRRRTSAHKGERHHNARFTEAEIIEIRTSPLGNANLGRQYGVARQVIGNIRQRKSWRHLP